jgi:NAD(P)-dependent dehydrogenase (short-subunit alcohol dehydrogenase family)
VSDNRAAPLPDPFAEAGPGWLEGRTALVTGGGQSDLHHPGVGYAICRTYAAHGARVAVVDRDPVAARRTVEHITALGGTARAVRADVTDDQECRAAVKAVLEEFGVVDALVNNVAVPDRAGLFDVEPDRWEELINLNLTSAWLMTRHVVPVLPGGSAIVNISSVGARGRGPGMVYNVAKAGLENLTTGAANSLGPHGIRVNCVQVGAIWSAFAAKGLPESMREPRRRSTALGTEGTSWDIAAAALFLAGDRARWISGQILAVDGGPGGPMRLYPEHDDNDKQTDNRTDTTEGSRG